MRPGNRGRGSAAGPPHTEEAGMAMKGPGNGGSARKGRERRGSERADARLSMRVEADAAGAARIVTETQNVSSSGVYCYASHYLAPLSRVQITLVLPKIPGGKGGNPELMRSAE